VSERVDERLLVKLENRLGLSRSQVNRRIAEKARELFVPRRQAALAVAAQNGINVGRLADAEDLAALRGAVGAGAARTQAPAASVPTAAVRPKAVSRAAKKVRKDPSNSVFVVYGRNERLRTELFAFLRNLGVNPIEWSKAIELSQSASPYIGQVIDAGFKKAVAIVVLLSADDEGCLKPELRRRGDPAYERKLTGQPRLNVVFEAGRAFGTHPNATVLVQIGRVRPFSDLSGRHVVHLSNSAASRQEFATKLENAGCRIDRVGTDWLTKGDFSP
jgi:predicted nucleotide-binding protein